MKKAVRIRGDLIQSLRDSLAPSEESEMLRQQLKTLKEYLKENHPILYLSTFAKQGEGVEPKISLKTSKRHKKMT